MPGTVTLKYAIDIDGTISKRPDVFRQLIDSVGIENCVCLTGSTNPEIPMEEHLRGRTLQLKGLIGSPIPSIHVCVAVRHEDVSRMKGVFCAVEKIDVLIDDCTRYCDDTLLISPKTLVLQVRS